MTNASVEEWAIGVSVIVGAIALAGIYFTIRGGRKQQRIESSPYIRVDIGTNVVNQDFKLPTAYYVDSGSVADLFPDLTEDKKVTVSAWVTNQQSHPLGFALRVVLVFIYETPDPTTPARFLTVRIPYLEYDKPVQVDLIMVSQEEDCSVRLLLSRYYDFYDENHVHRLAGEGTNALHGRLEWTYTGGRPSSVPSAWPRGRNVRYD